MEMNSTKPNCMTISLNFLSPGVFIGQKFSVSEFLSYSVPLFELQLGIILMTAHGLSYILGRFGISMFISQVLAGIILGPTILGRFNFMKEVVFPIESSIILNHAVILGFLLHIFFIAVSIDLESVKRLTGKLAIITGIASVVLPTVAGMVILRPFADYFNKRGLQIESKVMIYVQCFTGFSVVVSLKELRIRNSDIKELRIRNSDIGHLLLSLAMISSAISIQDNFINEFRYGGNGKINACAYIGFVIFLAFLIRPGMNWVVKRTLVGSPVDSSITCSLMLMGLISETYCHMFNVTPGLGLYTFGILVPAGPPLGSALVEKFETFNNAVLMPVAIVISAMSADFSVFFTHFGETRIYMLYVIVIGVTKMLAFMAPMLFWGIPFTDSVLFATILNNKGTIEMAVLKVPGYSVLIFNTLATSIGVTMIVKRLYDPAKNYVGHHNRNVTSLNQNSQLRILVCIHDQNNIYSMTGFLDVFHPTKERFLVLGVLHLVPLTGVNTPMIISHDKKDHPVTLVDYPSDSQVIISFDQYEQKNPSGISVSTYTAISTVSLMNEDILTLAFDHVASIVILPFHRKWSIHGRIESEDAKIRTINRKVLEKAPCSVAIFFDRGKLGRQTKLSRSLGTPLSICMIFLGGMDDWEALALAKRTVEDTSSRLTIIHLMLKNEAKDVEVTRDDGNDEYGDEDAKVLILEIMMKTYEQSQPCLHNIEYVSKFVNNGAETAMEICSIADKYDVFVVGRRYGIESQKTSGLSEWTDIPELGIIGDILACKDINTRAAVLVVQQQRKF